MEKIYSEYLMAVTIHPSSICVMNDLVSTINQFSGNSFRN